MVPESHENPNPVAAPSRVLFVCIGNSCRSQMAEALARHLASDVMEPSSAGLSPLGSIVEPTRLVLLERGVSVEGQYSKGLDATTLATADVIVNMSGMPGHALFNSFGPAVVDWEIEDPYGEEMEIYQRVCDEIEEKVRELAEKLRRGTARAADPA